MIENNLLTTHKRAASGKTWLAVVVGVALLERLVTILVYQPVAYSDTPSYRRLAETVLHGFSNYDGTRTPGYPVFLALTGTDQRAWLVQLFLGFLTTLLLFYIGWKLTDQACFRGVIALAHTLNLGQFFFESNLLTESLTTFLLVLTMAGVLVWLAYPKFRTVWLALIIGIVSSACLLVRPLFIYLPFFLVLYLWLATRPRRHAEQSFDNHRTDNVRLVTNFHPWRMAVAVLVPVVLMLGSWVTFIHKEFGEWALTTMTGYHLVQHTGNFFEYVPDEYASLRDIYIKYRDAHIAQYGTQTNAIWDAIPEMSKVSGYSFYALSRVLASISIQLILHHPLLFIKSAISGWWMFWRAPVYWSAGALKFAWLAGGIKILVQLQRYLLILVNFIFIITSLVFTIFEGFAIIRRKSTFFSFKHQNPTLYSFLWMLLANIWIASILQTLLDHGDNPRFLVPLQSLVVLWVLAFAYQLAINWRIKSEPSAQT